MAKFKNKSIIYAIGLILTLSACGPNTLVKWNNSGFNLDTNKDVAQQINCIDKNMMRSGLKFSIAETNTGWELLTSQYTGALTGWTASSKIIRSDQNVQYYGLAGNFGLDAAGIRQIVWPIVNSCS